MCAGPAGIGEHQRGSARICDHPGATRPEAMPAHRWRSSSGTGPDLSSDAHESGCYHYRMADPLSIVGTVFKGPALKSATSVLKEIIDPGAVPFGEIRRRHGAEAAFEFTLAFERHCREQEARNASFAEELKQRVTEREVCALFPVLLRAAVESTTRERMRMLCAALAGLWRPDFTAELRSRVSRTVLELEPSDLLLLRSLEADEREPRAMLRLDERAEWLVRTGCVLDPNGRIGAPRASVTALGHSVLEAVSTWRDEL